MAKGPKGFTNVANSISKKSGVSKQSAKAILASATRKASPDAKAKNPALKRVKMPKPMASKKKY